MTEGKRFYWIKLKEDFFNIETIDWILSQNSGCEYIVLYQKMCLLAANKGGNLEIKIGENTIPYSADKIARDTKFSAETVETAMKLFKKTGLICEKENGILHIPYVDEIVGSETSSAVKKRKQREKKKINSRGQCRDNVGDNVGDNVPQEIRDKRIENRDKKKENRNNKIKRERFFPPTLEEVSNYCFERNNKIDAERFIDYYQSKGWKVGTTKMTDWKSAIRNWERRDKEKEQPKWEYDNSYEPGESL